MLGRYSFDHAGIGETSLMLALCPEAVDASRFGENDRWFTRSVPEASRELGEEGVAMILDHLRRVLGTTKTP
jgi:creatinine amidohydrolase